MEGRTKSLTSVLVQNLSPTTCGWKDGPSHSQVPHRKFKSSYLRVEGRTKSLTSALVQYLSPTSHGWKDGPSHSQVPCYSLNSNRFCNCYFAFLKQLFDSKLDVTIGPYETYEDALFGYKETFEAFIGVRDDKATAQLQLFGDNLRLVEEL
nr:nudix hydrolase 3 [Quercus suber]